jgi:peptidoglycan/LPS O-acetylase OafA/YrhL
VVEAVNRRALTIFLWHQAVIAFVRNLALVAGVSLLGGTGGLIQLTSVFVLVGAVVLSLGWVEDLAARRRPQLVPLPRRTPAPRLQEHPAPVPA